MKQVSLFLFTLISMAALGQTREISLASDIWPPFTNIEGQKAIATELVTEALNRSGVKVNSQILDFEEVIDGIGKKTYDGSAALWYSEERQQTMLYSIPYLQNRLILVGRKGMDVSAKSMAYLKGKRVAIVDAYDYGFTENHAIDFIHGKSDQENLRMLLQNEADYMLVDALLLNYLMTYQEEEAKQYLEIGTTALVRRSLHFAIRSDLKDAKYIMDNFNKEITRMIGDGTYNRILELNWIRTDINGDGQAELVLNGKQAGTLPPTMPYSVIIMNPGTTSPNNNERYYIDGQIYDSWNNVPNQYKTVPNVPASNNIPVFRFKLN